MRAFAWALAVLMVLGVAADAQTEAKAYRISGVATSSRDGAPVPFCVLHLSAAEAAVQVGSGPRTGPPGGFASGRFEGGDRFGRHDTSRAHGRAAAAQAESTTADAQGRFSLEAPGAGAWLLTGVARGFHSQAYEAHEDFASAIVLTDARPAAQVNFRLAADAMIAGAVLDEAGEAVQGAQVMVERSDAADANGREAVAGFGLTDDRGRYEVAALAPGAYRVWVEARPWYAAGGSRFGGAVNAAAPESALDPSLDVVYPTTWFPGAEDARAAEVVRLLSGEVRQADFHLQALAAAHLVVARPVTPVAQGGGRNEDRGWTGPMVTRVTAGGNGVMTGNMRATTGSWEVTGLAPGTYQVRMPGADGRPGTDVQEFTVQPGGAGAVDLASAKPLLRVGLDFTGADAGRIDVTLTEAMTGRRYSTAGSGRTYGRQDDSEPRGRSLMVAAGEYRVSVAGSDTAYLMGVSATGAQMHGDRVAISGDGASLTLQLANGRAELDGMAALATKPAASAMVLLVPATADMGNVAERTARDETNSDGSFELRGVLPGPYILVVVNEGWGTNWRDPATLAGLLLHGVPVDLKPGARVKLDVQATSL